MKRRRFAAWATVLCSALAIVLSACGAPSPTPNPTVAVSQTATPQPTPRVLATRLLALLTGQLVREGACLRVRSTVGPETYLLVWAPDFDVTITGDTVQVADTTYQQRTTWRLGDIV